MKYFLFLLLFIPYVCSAVVPISEYLKYKEEPFMISYVWGVSNGILLSNALQEDTGGVQNFCMPSDIGISNDESIQILEEEIRHLQNNKVFYGDTIISIIYMGALERKFPCSRSYT